MLHLIKCGILSITKLTTEEVFLAVNDLHNIIHIVFHAWFLSRLVIPANKMGHSYLKQMPIAHLIQLVHKNR